MNKIKTNKLSKTITLLKVIGISIKSVISLLKLAGISSSYHPRTFEYLTKIFLKELSNKGPKLTIQLFKLYARVVTCLILGSPFEDVPRRKVLRGTKIPKDLGPLLYLLKGTNTDKRILMTMMNIYKVLRLPPSDDLSAITNGGPVLKDEFIQDFTSFIRSAPNFLVNISHINSKKQREYLGYMSSTNGPNGPSLRNVHNDAYALIKDVPLYESVQALLDLTAPLIGDNLRWWKEKIDETPDFVVNSIHSKVSQLSEGGGKTRNIAILDYFSQSALNFIHDKLMMQLGMIRSDSTFNQEDGFKLVIAKASQTGKCYSYDLSSATDRFPLALQTIVIKHMFGSTVGGLWEKVISQRSFHIGGKQIRWAVGQPLGALSSWAAFTLTHHLFIRWCANDYHFEDYVILGDDVAIMDSDVADIYNKRMSEVDVVLNHSKGFVSEVSPNYGEFAKRVFLGEDEFTGLPIDLMISAHQTLYMIPDFISFLTRRWKIVIPGLELYAPDAFPQLSQKGRMLLKIVLSFRQSMEAEVNFGFPWCALNSGTKLINRVRKHYLLKYQERISTFFDEGSKLRNKLLMTKLVNPIKESQGNHVSNMVVMSIRSQTHAISLLGLKLMGVLSDTDMNISSNLRNLDKLLVEFVPDVQLRSYYYDRKTVRNITIGKTALQFYYEDIKTIVQ